MGRDKGLRGSVALGRRELVAAINPTAALITGRGRHLKLLMSYLNSWYDTIFSSSSRDIWQAASGLWPTTVSVRAATSLLQQLQELLLVTITGNTRVIDGF